MVLNETEMQVTDDKVQEKDQTPALQGLISDELLRYFNFYVMGVACASISVFGLVTNVINAVVFFKQGLKDSVTLSLFSLTISDMCTCFCTLFTGLCFIAHEMRLLDHLVDWMAVWYVLYGWTRGMFLEISNQTTVYISLERCLLIVFPLHFKSGMTVSRAKKILAFIYSFYILSYIPIYASQGFSWQRIPPLNETKLSLWLAPERYSIEVFSNTVMGIVLRTCSYIAVIVSASVMIRGLHASAKFRSRSSTVNTERKTYQRDDSGCKNFRNNDNDETDNKLSHTVLTNKDRKVVKLVCLVVLVFILCTLPAMMIVYARRFMRELDLSGRYNNIHNTLFGFVYFVSSINASVNIFIYFSGSSRYKDIFYRTFFGSNK